MQMINMRKIGERIGVPYATVRWWRRIDRLPPPDLVLSPRVMLWQPETIDRWNEERRASDD